MDDDKQRLIVSTKGKRLTIDLLPEDADSLFLKILELVVSTQNYAPKLTPKGWMDGLVMNEQSFRECHCGHCESVEEEVGVPSTETIEEASSVIYGVQTELNDSLFGLELCTTDSSISISENKTESRSNFVGTKNRSSRVENLFGKQISPSNSPQFEAPLADRPIRDPKDGYWGFVIIRCSHCGELKATNFRDPVRMFECSKCGYSTELNWLKSLYANCACGKRYIYRTNVAPEDGPFEITCFGCEMPLTIAYDEEAKVFQTVVQEW